MAERNHSLPRLPGRANERAQSRCREWWDSRGRQHHSEWPKDKAVYIFLGSYEGEMFSSARELVSHSFRPPSANDNSIVAGRITPLSVNSRKALRFCRYVLICRLHRTVVASRSRFVKKESERIRRDSPNSAVATHATECG
jgi:hypothetical protein